MNEYNRKHYKRYSVNVSVSETDVINKLNSVDNRSKYIIDLIKKDIKK